MHSDHYGIASNSGFLSVEWTSGPMPTLTTQALAESAHQIKGQWENLAALSVRLSPLVWMLSKQPISYCGLQKDYGRRWSL
jgi:hypothetical protein